MNATPVYNVFRLCFPLDPCMSKECGGTRKCLVTGNDDAVCGMTHSFLLYCSWIVRDFLFKHCSLNLKYNIYLLYKILETEKFFLVSTHVLDLVFALDGSESLTKDEFENLKEFVIKSLPSYSISREKTRVGVIEYSDEVSIKLPLHQYFTIKQITEAVRGIEPSRGRQVVTDKALKTAADDVFSITSGGRPGAAKVLVVITDDASTGNQAISEAVEPLKKAGIQIHIVAIGSRVPRKEQEDITSGDENIHVVPRPDELPGKAGDVADVVDKAIQNRK